MRLLALLLAAAGLSGCVAYPYGAGPYYGSSGYYSQGGYYSPGVPYVVEPQSVFIYGSSRHYGRPHHDFVGPGHRGNRDLDGDGIPNRIDRDRDGDGVPNRMDRSPWNPRRN